MNDYCYVFKQKGTWKLWIDIVRRQEPELDQHGVFVATADTARYSHLIEMHIKVLIKFILLQFNLNKFTIFFIFSIKRTYY